MRIDFDEVQEDVLIRTESQAVTLGFCLKISRLDRGVPMCCYAISVCTHNSPFASYSTSLDIAYYVIWAFIVSSIMDGLTDTVKNKACTFLSEPEEHVFDYFPRWQDPPFGFVYLYGTPRGKRSTTLAFLLLLMTSYMQLGQYSVQSFEFARTSI